MNNVLIFTKYYTYYHSCRLARETEPAGEAEKFAMNKRIFDKPIVDMRALFGFLVTHLGTRVALDPVTKDDALWRLVEFFTRPSVAQLAAYSDNACNTLDDKDLARYLANRSGDKKAFERTTQVLLRLKSHEGLHNDVIASLKEARFSPDSVRSAYLRLKQLNSQKNLTFSEKNLEYFLSLFKQLEMWPETVDLCSHFDKLSGVQGSEIRDYYLAEALLQMPAKEHYHEVIKKAVYDGKELSQPGYITAATKALLKDGAVEHAFKYFESEIGKLRGTVQKQEDFLVSLFDSVYGELKTGDKDLTYEEYRARYLEMVRIGQACA